ncbi:YjjW family glycine radical enzyme activase [Oryzibacter oryziterrae]|uniref:YjjW family glycine radical enzyme activase n=1 Tax=Oryzibacter oryziterrae TaxID=2766474 RepID=UPI001F02CCEC|nr:YjjW family glycine radical enzyme activase [Oryzibacter oryziterrae]
MADGDARGAAEARGALTAQVSKILTWSVVDGPGNRFVLFLQGCTYRCLACHNPHTIGQCDHCGACVATCPSGALSLRDGRVVHDPAPCTSCDTCLRTCPINANPMVQTMTVADVLARIRTAQAFLTGITVSGGEATMQLRFVSALFAALKTSGDLRHLSCMIDSNGHLGPRGWASVLPFTDGVLLDIKAFDPDRHRRLTGRSNERSIASARLLAAAGKLSELRLLMIPGETDLDAEIDALTRLVLDLSPETRIRLNAFQHHGVRGEAREWAKMERDGVERAAERLRAAGVKHVAVPTVWLP